MSGFQEVETPPSSSVCSICGARLAPILNQLMIALFLGQNIVAEKAVYRLCRRQRENVLITLQAVFNAE